MEVKGLFLLLFSLHQIFCWNQISNISNLLTTYEQHCGSDVLCSTVKKAESFDISPRPCPLCFCTEDCEVDGNCCPDKFLTRTCVQSMFQFKTQRFVGKHVYLMVSSCPKRISNLREDNCWVPINHTNFLNQVPVYSPRSNRTYINVQCSTCHGEDHVVPWRYYIECPRENVDLDFYTNVSHLWNDMQENNCTIDYIPPFDSTVLPCDKEPSLIGECNVTGHWEDYDEDILFACKQYRNQYGVFQNIFCYFCNTARIQRVPLFSKDTNFSFVKANECASKIVKNTCVSNCNLCRNNFTLNNKNTYTYSDTTVAINEEYDSKSSKYSAFINVLSWDAVDELRSVLSQRNVTIDSIEENIVNLTSLYEEFVKSGGYENWCQENHTVEKIFPGYKGRRDCSCDDDCYKYSACCPDAAFYQRMDCVPGFLSPISNSRNTEYFYLISKCPIDYKFSYLKSKCEESSELNLFDIPVTDARNNKAYKNLYCYLCHHQHEINTLNFTMDHVKIWNVTLTCADILFPMHVTAFTFLLKLAFDKSCFIQYKPTNFVNLCKAEENDVIDKCNATGLIESLSRSAKTLCENTGSMVMTKSRNFLFKNKICDFCNNKVYEDPLSKCVFHNLDRVFRHFSFFPEVISLDVQAYPYKNHYYRECNTLPETGGLIVPDYTLSYRDIFSISDQISTKTDSFLSKECSKDTFKDTYKVHCFKTLI